MINFHNYMDFLVRKRINANQFILTYFIYSVEIGEGHKYFKLIKEYADAFGFKDMKTNKRALCSPEEKEDLVKKKLLIRLDDKEKASSYKATDEFKRHFITMYEATQQFFAEYPGFALIKGKRIPLKTAKIMPRDELRKLYMGIIKGDRSMHEEILKDVRFAKEHNFINFNIGNFIENQYWNDIRPKRLEYERLNKNTPTHGADFY
jgi:hypothetical protein